MKTGYVYTFTKSQNGKPPRERPRHGNCSRCGRYAELNGGGKNGRKPQFCDACIRGQAEKKGVSHG